MESILAWIGDHHEVLGFFVASTIFFITIFLVSRKQVGFTITLLLLLFSLIAGFSVAYQNLIFNFFQCPPCPNQEPEIATLHQSPIQKVEEKRKR